MRIPVVMMAVVLGLAGSSAASCGHSSAHDLCKEVCDCELCNDRKESDCVIQASYAQDIANDYGCDPKRQTYDDCRLHAGTCNHSQWDPRPHGDDCAVPLADLCDCIKAAADIADATIQEYFPCP